MPDTINGLPLHPLVVHAVVVLLPLAALGVIALAVRPAWRARFGWLVVAGALLATAAIPVAAESGESLEKRVGDPGRHAQLGDTLIWFAIPLLLVSVALVWLDRRARNLDADASGAGGGGSHPAVPPGAARTAVLAVPLTRRSGLNVAVAVLAVLIAISNVVQVFLVGESGAKAVWGNTPAETVTSQTR